MTRGRKALVLVATIAATILDNLVVIASFLSNAVLGEWLLAMGLALAVLGLAVRRAWPVFVAQNGVILLSTIHATRGEGMPDIPSLLYFTGVLLLGNLLAWPLARYAASRARA